MREKLALSGGRGEEKLYAVEFPERTMRTILSFYIMLALCAYAFLI